MNYFCKKCQHKIAEKGLPYHELYFSILDLFLDYMVFAYQEDHISSSSKTLFKLMESNGLLITKEISQDLVAVMINPESLSYHEKQNKFCFLKDESHFRKRLRKTKGQIDTK